MHIKTRMDLIMEALQASRLALDGISINADDTQLIKKIQKALGKIAIAYNAVNGTEERP